MKNKIANYIKYTISATNKLNGHVPNSHIGLVFSEVYEFIEYYESGDHVDLFSKIEKEYDYNFEDMVNEVFVDDELTDEKVHDSYQMLREKRNMLRNVMKLLIIEDNDMSVMNKRIKRGMFKIHNEFEGNG